MKGMILDRHIQNAQSYGMHRFKAGLLKIDEAELKFESTAQSPDVLKRRTILTASSVAVSLSCYRHWPLFTPRSENPLRARKGTLA